MQLTRHLLKAYPFFVVLFRDVLAAKNYHCPPLGPVLPAPTSPSSHPAVQSAVAALKEGIDGLSVAFNGTAVSIGVQSIHETAPLADLHYTPPILDPRGASQIDASTVYRVGSVSKVFAVLATLKTHGVRMEDPVTKYVPRLRELAKQQKSATDRITTVDWDDITIQSLASHMGGIGSDLVTDLATFPVNWTQLGLPQAHDVLGCVGFNGMTPCNETDFWDNFGKRNPVFAPYSSPLYSNTAFFILSLIVESVSGIPFNDFVQKNIFDVAGMSSSTYAKPDDKVGAISLNDLNWNSSLGIEDPAGGLYSNTKDLLAFGTAILTNKFLSPTQTRQWLKPVTFTSSWGYSIGAPWEILRSDNVTSDKRLIDYYTKGGDVGSYHANFVLIPDYDLVISILTTGPEASSGVVQLLDSQIITTLLPAIETAGKDDARAAFVGTYVDKDTNSTFTLDLDDEGPGLNIKEWTVRGTDVPSHWLNYLSALVTSLPEVHISMRLYPSGLTSGSRTAWRVAIDLGTPEQIAQADGQLFWPQASCLAWGLMDRSVYEFGALDEMVFSLEESESGSTATGVDLVGFQVTLQKTQHSITRKEL
ncbi:beta-lactamase/transpeptidase-like protein [Hypomontagnella monticulosa]|nr:beta-lactamase/transpeptidase-like protein [Hypomontagnella monticulosa]